MSKDKKVFFGKRKKDEGSDMIVISSNGNFIHSITSLTYSTKKELNSDIKYVRSTNKVNG